MPRARSAMRSGSSALPGTSAMRAAVVALAGIRPITIPPSFTKSADLRSRARPTPMMISRETSSAPGAASSRAEPLLPLNRSANAARFICPLNESSRWRMDPANLIPSSQNSTRTSGLEACKLPNSSFSARAMRPHPSGVAGMPFRCG